MNKCDRLNKAKPMNYSGRSILLEISCDPSVDIMILPDALLSGVKLSLITSLYGHERVYAMRLYIQCIINGIGMSC